MGPRALAVLLLLLLSPTAPTAPAPDPGKPAVDALLGAGRYDEALAAARDHLAAVEAASGADSAEAARAIGLVVRAGYWSSTPKDPDLLKLARRGLAIDEKRSGPESAEAAESLAGLANILIAGGDLDEAKGCCERSLAIREKLSGPESGEAAGPHRCLGLVLEDRGDLKGARAEVERALALQEKALDPDDPEIGFTLNSLASVYRQLGEYPLAIASRRRCLAIREKAYGPDHPQVAWAVHNLANLYADLGEFEAAKDLYARALAIRERILPPDHPDLGYSRNSLGIVAYGLGDYASARGEYERALAIREKALGADHPLVAATLNNLGNLADEMGEPEAARDLLSRALDIKTRKLGPGHVSTAMTANNLGNVLGELGDLERAEDLTRRALDLREKELGPDHPDVGRSLDDLGWLRRLRGDAGSGVPLLERAVAVREKALGSGHPDVASSLTRLAVARSESGDAAAALADARRGLEIRRRALGPDHPSVAESLSVVAAIDVQIGDAAAALPPALESEAVGRAHFRLTARHLSQREALRFEEARASGLDAALQALAAAKAGDGLAGRAGDVLDAVIRSRALVLDALGSRRREAVEAASGEARRRLEALNGAATALARLARRESDPEHPERLAAQIRAAREKEERAERDLIEVSPSERRWSEAGRIDLAAIRRALPGGAALVSYVRFAKPSFRNPAAARGPATPEGTYAAFVTTGNGGATAAAGAPPAFVPLGSAAAIEEKVARWREAAARGARTPSVALARLESEYRAVASDLRKAIWDPVAKRLPRGGRVFVVPDGALDLVSLAALPSEAPGYLAESGPEIHYLSSERDLVAPERTRSPGSGLLAVGGVDYGAPSPAGAPAGAPATAACSPFASLRFAPLAGARGEIDAISRGWKERGPRDGGPALELTGTDAKAAAVLAAAPGKRVVHLATHAFFLEDRCPPRAGDPPSDPMLLSGLALAGANLGRGGSPSADDGLVTAEEIAALDLSGVEWAVLSACDTGGGEVRSGEGVLGLRRAFELAGAGTLIMSLWSVRDEDAAEWMAALYAARFRGLPAAEAVRRADLDLLAARRAAGRATHPASWGAFVAYGDWR